MTSEEAAMPLRMAIRRLVISCWLGDGKESAPVLNRGLTGSSRISVVVKLVVGAAVVVVVVVVVVVAIPYLVQMKSTASVAVAGTVPSSNIHSNCRTGTRPVESEAGNDVISTVPVR